MVKPWSSGKDEQQYQRRLRAAVGIVRAESCGRDKTAKRATCGKSYGGNEERAQANSPPLTFHGKARSTVQPTGATFHSYGSGEGGRFRGGEFALEMETMPLRASGKGRERQKCGRAEQGLEGGWRDLN